MQRRNWNYLDDDKTRDLSRWLTGVLPAGLYFGFDFAPSANMNLGLNHNTSGYKDVDYTGAESTFQSLVITRQGVHVREDAAITINGVAVGDATHPRIDVVVLSHSIVEVAGGSQALYSIIQGTPAASPVAPALTNPLTQIKIGELYIPALVSALNAPGVTWTRQPAPNNLVITPNRVAVSNGGGAITASGITTTELNFLSGLSVNVQTGKQDTITGGATTITGTNLTINRALASNGSGKVVVSAVTDTELGYLGGVTSAIQTQINGKQDTITGGATTILTSNLTVNRALASNASGKVVVSAVTDTELGYLAGVSSAIQTQINGKQATVTGGATTILTSDLTINRALASNSSGKVVVSAVTDTELGYLAGVTSAIQTQLGTKNDKLITTNRQTASYTLAITDADKLVEMNVASANNLTVPANATVAFAIGTVIGVSQYGAGKTTIVAAGGVTLRSDGAFLALTAQYTTCVLVKIGTNEWYVFGNLGA